jgi:hypothetical protein
MKAYGGVDVQIRVFLTLALVRGEWSASRHCRFNPGENAPGSHWIECWMDPRAGFDDVEKRKFLTLPGLKLRSPLSPSPQPVVIPTTLSRLMCAVFYTESTAYSLGDMNSITQSRLLFKLSIDIHTDRQISATPGIFLTHPVLPHTCSGLICRNRQAYNKRSVMQENYMYIYKLLKVHHIL